MLEVYQPVTIGLLFLQLQIIGTVCSFESMYIYNGTNFFTDFTLLLWITFYLVYYKEYIQLIYFYN